MGEPGTIAIERKRSPISSLILWALVGLFLLGFFLRAYRLESQSVWVDEGFAISLAGRNLGELFALWYRSPQEAYTTPAVSGQSLLTLAAEVDIHPPLYYYLLHFWLMVVAREEFSLRFLSVIFGILNLPILFCLGRRLLNERVGLAAAAIAAVSPFYIDYSQQVRMYSLVTFLSILSVYSMFIIVQARFWSSPGYWVVYVLSTVLALYTHYFAVFILLFENIIILGKLLGFSVPSEKGSTEERGTMAFKWLIGQGAVLLLFLPWIPVAINQIFQYQNKGLPTPDWIMVLPRTWMAFNLGLSVDQDRMAPLLAALLVLFLAGSMLTGWRLVGDRRGMAILLLFLMVPILSSLVVFQRWPMFHPKYLMVASPAYYLLLAMVIVGLWQSFRWVALPMGALPLAAMIFGLYAYNFDTAFAKDDTRSLAQYLEAKTTSADLILYDLMEPFGFYYRGSAPHYYLPASEDSTPTLLSQLASGKRVFLVHYAHSYTDVPGLIPFLLEKYGQKIGENRFRGYYLTAYRLISPPPFEVNSGPRPSSASFENTLTLKAFEYGASPASESHHNQESPIVPVGEKIWAVLRWELANPVRGDYKVSLRLTDAHGHIAGQRDLPLLKGMLNTSRWEGGDTVNNYYILPTLPGTPPGTYDLQVNVYNSSTLRSMAVVDQNLQPQGINFRLGSVVLAKSPVAPSPDSLGISQPADVDLKVVQGLGYDVATRALGPGQTLSLTLYWKLLQRTSEDYGLRFQLVGVQGDLRWEYLSRPSSTYPFKRWEVGESGRDWQDILISARVPAGEYRLRVALVSETSGETMGVWDLGKITVQERVRRFDVPPITNLLGIELDGRVRLLGYDLTPLAFKGGDVLRLTLYWQALREMEVSYTVFTHLIDVQNRIWTQRDGFPVGGTYPTSGWSAGEVIVDGYDLIIPSHIPVGEYLVEVGMYESSTGRRLIPSIPQARVSENAILLTRVQISR